MDLTQLTIIAGSIVTESKLSKPAKLQMLTWLENEATEAQLKAFLMDGAIIQLDEQAEQIVNDRFENSKLSEIDVGQGFGNIIIRLSQGEATVAGALAAAAIIALSVKAIRRIRTAEECKDFRSGTPGYKKCHINVKIKKLQAQIAVINAKAGLCKKAKDPEKCNSKLKAKIAKLKAQIESTKGSL